MNATGPRLQTTKISSRSRLGSAALLVSVLGAVLSAVACGDPEGPPAPSGDETFSVEQLMDPKTCAECHRNHYDQWAGSMHAYAAEDPVFLAMNELGQRETGGALGNFCVNCHAPMAVKTNATGDGRNLAQLPDALKGVTCYYCHNAAQVNGTHNNPIELGMDTTMRGAFADAVPNRAHKSAHSPLLDGRDPASSTLCGSCHDIVVSPPLSPAEVHLERTFQEWGESLFAPARANTPSAVLTCGSTCHMKAPEDEQGRPKPMGPAAEGPGLQVGNRRLHAHEFPGVDVALTPFPRTGDAAKDEALRAHHNQLVERMLDQSLRVDICVVHRIPAPDDRIVITLDNFSAGHFFPSGASQDRRLWVEVQAYVKDNATPVYEAGIVADGQPAVDSTSPNMWILRDRLLDSSGNEVHMFWQAASVDSSGTIPGAVTTDKLRPDYYKTHVARWYPSPPTGLPEQPDRVTVKVRMQPIGLEVLDELIAAGVLDPSARTAMPTFTLRPNRHLMGDLASLGTVTFEWSEATRASPNFDKFGMPDVPNSECIGMPRKP